MLSAAEREVQLRVRSVVLVGPVAVPPPGPNGRPRRGASGAVGLWWGGWHGGYEVGERLPPLTPLLWHQPGR